MFYYSPHSGFRGKIGQHSAEIDRFRRNGHCNKPTKCTSYDRYGVYEMYGVCTAYVLCSVRLRNGMKMFMKGVGILDSRYYSFTGFSMSIIVFKVCIYRAVFLAKFLQILQKAG